MIEIIKKFAFWIKLLLLLLIPIIVLSLLLTNFLLEFASGVGLFVPGLIYVTLIILSIFQIIWIFKSIQKIESGIIINYNNLYAHIISLCCFTLILLSVPFQLKGLLYRGFTSQEIEYFDRIDKDDLGIYSESPIPKEGLQDAYTRLDYSNELEKFKTQRDSIRNKLISKIAYPEIKNSPIVELFIRNLAIIKQDSIYISIPFDLHFLDCRAPDCYTTQLTFKIFRNNNKLVWPQILKTSIYESGCDANLNKSLEFIIVANEFNAIKYYDEKNKYMLIFLQKDKSSNYAYLYHDVNKEDIVISAYGAIYKTNKLNDSNEIVPFRCSLMSKEY